MTNAKTVKSTMLQRVDFDPPFEVAELYLRQERIAALSEPWQVKPDGLHVPPGMLLSFDSYFNAFFENYWFGYTSLNEIELRLDVAGKCIISMWRQTPAGDDYLIHRIYIEDGGDVSFAVADDDELRVEAGRVWFEVEALGETVLKTGAWVTTNPPQRPVELGVVFCTFNREKYLRRILRSIDADDRAIDAVNRVFVVNQGNPFTADEIVGADSTGRILEKLTIIEQPNMGGCGGFTRGMHEAVIDPALTHFLLMDDDSRVNAESIARSADFLSYSHDNVTLGGHMLNLHRPQRLFEAGAMLDPLNLQPRPLHSDTALGEEEGLEPFLRPAAVSYNGWWMFGAATSLVEEIGYPMPCFIRGDDMEYGLRVRDSGCQTIPMPGIAVWHEPFYLKLGGWQFFFEVRNRLAKASLHNHENFAAIRKNLGRVFARDIGMCRYQSCMLMIEALRAYSQGPDVALDTTDGPLQAAREIVAEYGPVQIEEVVHPDSSRGGVRGKLQKQVDRYLSRPLLVGQLGRRYLTSPGETKNPPVIRSRDLQPHLAAGADSYIVLEEHGNTAWQYTRQPELERQLWSDFRALVKAAEFDPRYLEAFESTGKFSQTWYEIFAEIDG